MANGTNIGLVIQLGGVDKAIKSVREFSAAIKEAEDRLLTISDKGSPAYQQLTSDIAAAKEQLQDFQKSVKGTKAERGLQEVISAGTAITAAFGAAQSAMLAFGMDNDKVARKAAQVQALVNIALTANTILQQKNTIEKIKNTAATVANTIASQGLIGSLRLLWATMLANPITAVLALFGALVSAVILFSDSNDDAAQSVDGLTRSMQANANAQNRMLAELEAQGLSQELLNAQRVIYAKNEEEAALKKAKLLQKESEDVDAINDAWEAYFDAQSKRRIAEFNQTKYIADQKEKAEKEAIDKAKQRAAELLALRREQLRIDQELLRNDLLRYGKGQAAKEQEFNKTLDTRITGLKEQLRILQDESTFIDKLNAKKQAFNESELDYLEKANILQTQRFGATLLGPAELPEGASPERMAQEQQKFNAELQKTYNELYVLQKRLADNPFIQSLIEEQKKLATNTALVEQAFTRINMTVPPGFAEIIQAVQEVDGGVAKTFQELQFINQQYEGWRKAYVERYVRLNTTLTKSDKLYKDEQAELTKTGEALFLQLVENQKNINTYNVSISELRKKVEELNKAQKEWVESGGLITQFIDENKDKIKNLYQVDLSAFGANANQIAVINRMLATEMYEDSAGFENELLALQEQLAAQGLDIEKASLKQKLDLLKYFLGLEVQAEEDAETKKQKVRQEKLDKTLRGIQEFQSVMNSLAQTTTMFYDMQLENLTRMSEEAAKQIVGDTEEANMLREENEKIYAEKRKQIEKNAAINSLRISLAQTLANTAEAITKAFTLGPVAGQIAAGLVAVLSASQAAMIGNQIAKVSSYQRGGLVYGPSHEYGGVKYQGGGIELEGGEAVINRMSAIKYGGLLNQINQLGGGKPMVGGGFDDSRIVEAIASQRNEPIRAYVLEQDITNKQGVTRRLEQLSQI